MTTIGIIGLGTMGLGIAQVYAAAGFPVIATDAHEPARATARTRMAEALQARITAGKLTEAARDATLANLTVVESLAAFAPCDLVIEAIVEKLEAKHSLFATLESIVRPNCILATNTSSIPVRDIAKGLSHPDRVLALHFFNPPTAMKLVELAPHARTLRNRISFALEISEKAGKTVVECPDRPGFIVNRCARPFYGEALALLAEGRSASDIDAAMLAAGYRLGPLSLIDLIGADINLAATKGMHAAMGNHPRYHVFAALADQVAKGHLGRKSGQGFLHPAQPGPSPADAAAIALRIEATLINEAHWLLSEGGTTAEGIDTAMKLGLNFPRGPFEALALHGREAVLATLAALQAAAPDALRPRYTPAPGLI
ncbi:3-hydroxyacyl-CoA dehydrogenase [Tabrizicola oligotrophica]|uniref:3-hydroxybutyryl-CoA dehydrogenase n=1 Tax=Tabrizicola oligotrophica TaxID=2710650 RepID=A0A6M0QPF6_9RHOB|nr:3-hydroxyacyl-CoA dehydrogenase NAD-binding domain-containing protein [Tabrizicola oligotrophica]NEY89370.1 3-hydroxybutyryl-CoA dehydrogenase [Tabrizicola oligotrophica]